MILAIHDNLEISDVQDHFAKCFPQLRLRFFSRPQKHEVNTAEEDEINPVQLIGDIRKKGNSGELRILSSTTVHELENRLQRDYDLYGQVLLKEKDQLVRLPGSGRLTLRQLSDRAGKFV